MVWVESNKRVGESYRWSHYSPPPSPHPPRTKGSWEGISPQFWAAGKKLTSERERETQQGRGNSREKWEDVPLPSRNKRWNSFQPCQTSLVTVMLVKESFKNLDSVVYDAI